MKATQFKTKTPGCCFGSIRYSSFVIRHFKFPLLAALLALLSTLNYQLSAAPLGTAFTYQGKLTDGGLAANGIYDLRFAIYDAARTGQVVAGPITNSLVGVTNGLFTTTLDFGAGVFTGEARWLEIAVRVNGDVGDFTLLTPHQPLTPAPHALYAPLAGVAVTASNLLGPLTNVQFAGLQTNALILTNAANQFAGNGAGLTKVNAGALDGLAAAEYWQLRGNTVEGTNPPVLGTLNNMAFNFLVNGDRALRIEPSGNSPKLIGGYAGNFAAAGAYGAFIGGGGGSYQTNAVFAPLAVIAGGEHNTVQASFGAIGGGSHNTVQSNANLAVIAGGYYNTVGQNSAQSAVVGGYGNEIGTNSPYAFIGGGSRNEIGANAERSVIGGGESNEILDGAAYATIPGGQQNSASGDQSFAAGYNARALHANTFVWSDGQTFSSTASNQFLVRATGGVGINKNNPTAALDVAGAIRATNFIGNGAGLTNLNAAALAAGSVPDTGLSTNVALRNANQTFTGTVNFSPASGPPFTVGSSVKVPMLNADTLDGHDSSFFWGTLGNGATLPGFQFIGTTDDTPLEFKVNGLRALRMEPTASGRPNLIGGAAGNFVAAGVMGATIAGGGATALTNVINANYGAIGGGRANAIASGAEDGTVGGGSDNTAAGVGTTVSGGTNNTAGSSSLGYATVGGGSGNLARGYAATVGGGSDNSATGGSSTVGGGNGNLAFDGAATVSGGIWNKAIGFAATVGGGDTNRADGDYATVAGGIRNRTLGLAATVGGGSTNWAEGPNATIGGGTWNLAIGSAATVGGGHTNQAIASHATIGGGFRNMVDGEYASVGGGYSNQANGYYASVGGGRGNAADGDFASVAGGFQNTADGANAAVPGGFHNRATGVGSFAAGRQAHCDHDGTFLWNDGSSDAFTTGTNRFEVYASSGAYFYSGTNLLYASGEMSCASLTIRGGADLAEPFAMSDAGIGPGAVVVIDEQNPGRLKLSTRAYDHKVAGIVSGAGGVRPGISMIQAESLEGGRNVALSGRVYALVDATVTPVAPGDLLTTSNTPGHAMKVTDPAQAHGAILGKAMGRLAAGRGLVLVLVSLQ